MLWLALYCPTLALDCLLRRWPGGLEPAMAVSDVDGTRRFIAATTRTAQACGVFAGQSVATALALLPDLLVVARRIEDERRALTEAALAVLRFTPTVSLRPSGLVLEISASLRLFGGRQALKKSIAAAMRVQGLGIVAAEAPTPHGAWLLAKEKARRRFEATQDALRQSRPSARERLRDGQHQTAPDVRMLRDSGSTAITTPGRPPVREDATASKRRPFTSPDPRLRRNGETRSTSMAKPRSDGHVLVSDRRVLVSDADRDDVVSITTPSRDRADDGPTAITTSAPGTARTSAPASGPATARTPAREPMPTSMSMSGPTPPTLMPMSTSRPTPTSIPIPTSSPAPLSTPTRTATPTPTSRPTRIATPTPASSPSISSSTANRTAFESALDMLPIAHLESLGPSARRMRGIGLFTLADLRRLPSKGVARRFGPALIDELARAAGDEPDPQIVFEAPTRFDARIELMARVESAEALVFASQRLLAQLSGWLTARRAAVRRFTLVLHHDRWTRDAIEPTPVDIALASPSSDQTRLLTLVRERLSRLELKAPVLELALEAPVIVEEQEAHHTLFPEREEAAETIARLLEKLTARLGHEAMARIERVADHRPERAWREVSGDLLEARLLQDASRSSPRTTARATHAAGPTSKAIRTKSSASTASSSVRAKSSRSNATIGSTIEADPDIGVAHRPLTPGCSSGPRPAWLLTEPMQLEVRVDRPLYESLPLALVAGPERIESGWWDDATVTRDYFIAENAAGHLVWVYRERLIAPDERPTWYLQGLFG